jgi:hypothetical protein
MPWSTERVFITFPLKYIELRFVCPFISWETSEAAVLLINSIAAAEKEFFVLPCEGLHGAKPMVVGRDS